MDLLEILLHLSPALLMAVVVWQNFDKLSAWFFGKPPLPPPPPLSLAQRLKPQQPGDVVGKDDMLPHITLRHGVHSGSQCQMGTQPGAPEPRCRNRAQYQFEAGKSGKFRICHACAIGMLTAFINQDLSRRVHKQFGKQ